MFWNKKEEKKSFIKVPDETRGAFRVFPTKEEPIKVKFGGKVVHIVDISSGGLSFKDDGFKEGAVEKVRFVLPGVDAEIRVKLKIVKIIVQKGICACQFVKHSLDVEDAISEYALYRQKQDMGKKGRR